MNNTTIASVPVQRPHRLGEALEEQASPDRRPRLLRRILPTAHASAIPLDGMQEARLKFIAYH